MVLEYRPVVCSCWLVVPHLSFLQPCPLSCAFQTVACGGRHGWASSLCLMDLIQHFRFLPLSQLLKMSTACQKKLPPAWKESTWWLCPRCSGSQGTPGHWFALPRGSTKTWQLCWWMPSADQRIPGTMLGGAGKQRSWNAWSSFVNAMRPEPERQWGPSIGTLLWKPLHASGLLLSKGPWLWTMAWHLIGAAPILASGQQFGMATSLPQTSLRKFWILSHFAGMSPESPWTCLHCSKSLWQLLHWPGPGKPRWNRPAVVARPNLAPRSLTCIPSSSATVSAMGQMIAMQQRS